MGLFWTYLDWEARKLYVQRQCYRGTIAELKRASSRRHVALGEVARSELSAAGCLCQIPDPPGVAGRDRLAWSCRSC
jgi:hypothetical protein